MYIVRDSKNEIVLIATLKEDAEAFAKSGDVDKTSYTIEDTDEQYFLELEDGIGEGQSW